MYTMSRVKALRPLCDGYESVLYKLNTPKDFTFMRDDMYDCVNFEYVVVVLPEWGYDYDAISVWPADADGNITHNVDIWQYMIAPSPEDMVVGYIVDVLNAK